MLVERTEIERCDRHTITPGTLVERDRLRNIEHCARRLREHHCKLHLRSAVPHGAGGAEIALSGGEVVGRHLDSTMLKKRTCPVEAAAVVPASSERYVGGD